MRIWLVTQTHVSPALSPTLVTLTPPWWPTGVSFELNEHPELVVLTPGHTARSPEGLAETQVAGPPQRS